MIVGNITQVPTFPSDWTTQGDLTVNGELTVTGDTSIIGNSYTYGETYIVDPITVVNYLSGAPVSGVATQYAGFEVDRGLLTNYRIVFDENDDLFKIGEVGSEQIVATRTDNISDNEIVIYDTDTKQLSGSGYYVSSFDSLQAQISSNDTDISTNAGNISANTGDISTNAGNISTNAGNISTNAGNISTNTGNISTNTGNISTNAGNISTNTGDISTHETRLDNIEDGTTLDSRYVNITGDTITGDLTVNGTFSATGLGDVSKTGTPVDNQLAIFTDANTVEGDSSLTFDGSILSVNNGATSYITLDRDAVLNIRSSANATIFKARVGGSGNDRFTINTDGNLKWGGGSGSTDVTLYRGAANRLVCGDDLQAQRLLIEGTSTYVDVSGNVMRFTDSTNGTVTLTQLSSAIDNYTDVNGDTYLGTLSIDSTQATIDATSAITSVQPTDEVLVRDASDSNYLKTVAFSDLGKYTDATVGDGSTNPITITHSLGTKDVVVSVRDNTSDELVQVSTTATSTTAISLDFTTTPTTNQYTVKVIS